VNESKPHFMVQLHRISMAPFVGIGCHYVPCTRLFKACCPHSIASCRSWYIQYSFSEEFISTCSSNSIFDWFAFLFSISTVNLCRLKRWNIVDVCQTRNNSILTPKGHDGRPHVSSALFLLVCLSYELRYKLLVITQHQHHHHIFWLEFWPSQFDLLFSHIIVVGAQY
jgi:hypothetical protein